MVTVAMRRNTRASKVFGLGLWRTGTTSLTRALRELGVRCKHYPYDKKTQDELWSEKTPLSILERYDAITDISIVPFYKTLDRLYPGSRFILTIRDEATWLDSMRRQIERLWNSSLMENPQFRAFSEAISERVYGGIAFEPERLATKYREHVADVQGYFVDRAGDLLTMNIVDADGWEKLCPFLGVPTPESPFPYVNAFRKAPYAWDRKVAGFLQALQELNGDMTKTILLDDARLRAYVQAGAKPIPFPERNGQYAGHPENGSHACDFLLEALAAGAQRLVLAWPAFWWLESYPEFARMLNDRFSIVMKNDVVLVYDLTDRMSDQASRSRKDSIV